MHEYTDDPTERLPVAPPGTAARSPDSEPAVGAPESTGFSESPEPATGPMRQGPQPVSVPSPVSPPVADVPSSALSAHPAVARRQATTTVRWIAIGGLIALAVCATVDAALPLFYAATANVGYLPISVPMAVAPLLPLFVSALTLWLAWGIHTRAERAAPAAMIVLAGVVFAVIFGADDGGPGVFALVLVLVAAPAIWLSTAEPSPAAAPRSEPASLTAAQTLLVWTGAGCLLAVLPAVIDAATHSAGAAPGFAAVLWLGSGTAQLLLCSRLGLPHARWATAATAAVTLLAAALSGGTGWALAIAGTHLAVTTVLLVATPIRRHFGQAPIAVPEQLTAAAGHLVDRSGGRVSGGAPGPAVHDALRRIPLLFVLAGAAGAVLFGVGAGTYGEHSATADSCTVAHTGRWAIVEDSPQCDAALNGTKTGQALMAAGAVVALALPARAFLRRDQSQTPPGPGSTTGSATP